MFQNIARSFSWSALLGAKFFQVFPLGICATILLTFVSQVALIASMLLPLKIVMIMSGGQLPNILPDTLLQMGGRYLVGVMTILAILAFLFNGLSSKLTKKFAEQGVERLLERNDKLVIFENQDLFLEKAYLRYSTTLSNLIFVILGYIALAFIYIEVALIILSYSILCITIYGAIWRSQPKARNKLVDEIPNRINIISNIGFLLSFLGIVLDYFLSDTPGFVATLLSIILTRQLLAKLTSCITGLQFLSKQKEKLQVLIFRDQAYMPAKPNTPYPIWDFMKDTNLKSRLISYIKTIYPKLPESLEFRWRDTEIKNIHFIILRNKLNGKDELLVKIFDPSKTLEAIHEAALLFQGTSELPSPPVIGATIINKHHIHVFNIKSYLADVTVTIKEIAEQFEPNLLSVAPSQGLIDQYQRSRSMLWKRIDQKTLDRIRTIAIDNRKSAIDSFEARIKNYRKRLQDLPLTFSTPTRKSQAYIKNNEGHIGCIHWGQWTLEPFAAGLRFNLRNNGPTPSLLTQVLLAGSGRSIVSEKDIMLSISLSKIDMDCRKHRYTSALNTISDLVDSETSQSSH